ncbi:sensor histidine kinase [Miniphocaeibacter massiliensis]|uniref:sensor histidine kinase n=1 Tax=Miniphocaeibacter massiliensis TaxID=2041841 RepID=UPI0013E9EBFF|nr:GHKL domain-containing protein [Miniphocaeibacter massiliensis]
MEVYHLYEGIPRFILAGIIILLYCELLDKKVDKKIFIKGITTYTILGQLNQIGIYYFYYNNLLIARDVFSMLGSLSMVFLYTYITYGRYNYLNNIFVVTMASIITDTLVYMNTNILYFIFDKFFKVDSFGIVVLTISLILLLIPYFILKKSMKNISVLDIFNTDKIKYTVVGIQIILILIIYNPILTIYFSDSYLAMVLVTILPLILTSICLIIYAVIKTKEKSLELNNTIIKQQETYIKSLESMQEDIRKYNHDYKNLLAGALLQAEEGDYEGVRLYLKDVLKEFEEKLGKQINKNTQLKKINQNEVKGLLLSKMMKMEEKNVEFHLEVLNEVEKFNMKTMDLVRCLGILLDNAIEEVEKLEEKVIKLIILKEDITTIIVKNPTKEKVNIQKIYTQSFSTKGKKRGIGLVNYKEIIEKYQNVVRETSCTENEFNQIIKIG